MSSFEILSKICDNLDSITRRFWWNPKKDNGRYLALNACDKMCIPKKSGGLGFRKNTLINMALLAKLAWMVASNRDSMCMNLLRRKDKVRKDWLRKEAVINASPIWKAIENSKKVIRKGACNNVGDGISINIWMDPWIPWLEGFKPRKKMRTQYWHL